MALVTGDAGNNTLPGTADNDRILGLGGNDRLEGLAGDDTLEGGHGSDTLYGGIGHDLLLGGAGNDYLLGSDGRDILVGGLGRDIMYGGAGPDVFRFDDRDAGDATAGPLSDVIRGFTSSDVIDLVAVDVFYYWGYGDPEPARGGFSIWQASGNTYITWNTFNGFHDIELTGYTGDPFSQIRWYEDDYLANVNTTGRIAAGQTRAGTIEVQEDSDWFRITLSEGQLYTFDVRGASDGGGTLPDAYVTLYDADGNFVRSDYDELQFAGAPGTYYVEASGGGTTGTYRLAVTARTYVDDYGNGIGTNGRIAAGQTRQGELEIRGDQDWFRIGLTEGVTYAISLRGEASGSGTIPDPLVVLHDAQGNEIAADDDGSGTLDSLLIFTADASGNYFIDARELDDVTGTYELSVEVVDPSLI